MREKRDIPIGLRVSSGFLMLSGSIFSLYACLFAIALAKDFSHVRHEQIWMGKAKNEELKLFLVIIICAALSYLLFRGSSGLRKLQQWAAYVAMAFGAALIWLRGDGLVALFQPVHAAAWHQVDQGEGIIFLPPLIVLGLWWCVYLNLPKVRIVFVKARGKPAISHLSI